MSILTAIFQAIGQAVTWVLPISESGHSSIFHDFSGRFSGNVSELTGLVHIGIALGIIVAFYKLFFIMSKNFFMTFGDLFHKNLNIKEAKGPRRFMYMTVISFVPMLLYLIPAGKYGTFYGLLRSMSYNSTLLDEGVFFLITGVLLYLATVFISKGNNDKDISIITALILSLIATIIFPIAGFSFVGVLFSMAVLFGVSKKFSLRYVMVLSVPVLVVSGIIEICKCVTYVNILSGAIAVLVSAVFAFLVSKVLSYIINKSSLIPFAYYNMGIGVIVFFTGIIQLIVR